MLEQIEPGAVRLRQQIMTSVDELCELLVDRARYRAEESDYLGQRTPVALAEVEMQVAISVPTQESGKVIPQARREVMVQKAFHDNDLWKQVNAQCKSAQRELHIMDGKVEALQVRIGGSKAVLGYYASMLDYLGGIDGAIRF